MVRGRCVAPLIAYCEVLSRALSTVLFSFANIELETREEVIKVTKTNAMSQCQPEELSTRSSSQARVMQITWFPFFPQNK